MKDFTTNYKLKHILHNIVMLLMLIFTSGILIACNSGENKEISKYKSAIEECQKLLEENIDNEEAIANYALTFLQYNHAVNKQTGETDKTNVDLSEAYYEFATYAYAYSTKISAKEAQIDEISAEIENQFLQTETYSATDSIANLEPSTVKCNISQSEYDELLNTGMILSENNSQINMSQSTEADSDWDFDMDDLVDLQNAYEDWFPYNTAPAEIWIESIEFIENGIVVGIKIDWHQMCANNVYFKWVDKHLAKGDPPEKLTWDIYVKLEWLEEDYPEFFAPPPTPLPKPTQPVEPPVIETLPVETETEEETEEIDYSDYKIGVNGNTTCYQELTGKVMTINGMTPVALFTELAQTPVGEQIHLQLLDANGNSVAVTIGDSVAHTAYRYAYITELIVSDSYTLFWVAGSDTEVYDNLSNHSTGSAETENGMQQYDRYENWPE